MESTPGQSGDSHPHHLIEQQREEYILHCSGLPQSCLFAEQVVQQAQEVAREDVLQLWVLIFQERSQDLPKGGLNSADACAAGKNSLLETTYGYF